MKRDTRRRVILNRGSGAYTPPPQPTAGAVISFGAGLPTGASYSATTPGNIWLQTSASTISAWSSGPLVETMSDGVAGIAMFCTYENRVGTDAGIGPAIVQSVAIGRIAGKFPTYVAATGTGVFAETAGHAMRSGSNAAEAGQGRSTSPAIKAGGGDSSSMIWARGCSDGANGLPTVNGDTEAVASPTDYTTVYSTDTTWKRYFNRGTNTQPYLEIRSTGAGSSVGDVYYWGACCYQRGAGDRVVAMLPLCDDVVTLATALTLNAALTADWVA